jgi:hypothetical protein
MWRRIFGAKRDKNNKRLQKMNDEEFHKLYSSPNIRWVGSVAHTGEKFSVLVGCHEGKKPHGRPRH